MSLDVITSALEAGELLGTSVIPSNFKPIVAVNVEWENFGSIAPGSTYKVSETQDEPEITFQVAPEKPESKYTVVLADPDAPSKEDNKWSPFLHFALADVVPGQTPGQTLVSYLGPAPPPKTGRHRYVFLVYQQPVDHVPELGVEPDARQAFDLAGFVKRNELELVGATYFFAQNEEQ